MSSCGKVCLPFWQVYNNFQVDFEPHDIHFKWRLFLPAWLWQANFLFYAIICSLSQILWHFSKQNWAGDVKLSIRAISYDSNLTICCGRECELTFAALGFYNHELFHVESEGNSNPVALEFNPFFKYQSCVEAQYIEWYKQNSSTEWEAAVEPLQFTCLISSFYVGAAEHPSRTQEVIRTDGKPQI